MNLQSSNRAFHFIHYNKGASKTCVHFQHVCFLHIRENDFIWKQSLNFICLGFTVEGRFKILLIRMYYSGQPCQSNQTGTAILQSVWAYGQLGNGPTKARLIPLIAGAKQGSIRQFCCHYEREVIPDPFLFCGVKLVQRPCASANQMSMSVQKQDHSQQLTQVFWNRLWNGTVLFPVSEWFYRTITNSFVKMSRRRERGWQERLTFLTTCFSMNEVVSSACRLGISGISAPPAPAIFRLQARLTCN